MTPWWEGPLVSFDLETTGRSAIEDRIVTASIVHNDGGDTWSRYRWLVKPEIPIPDDTAAIHGVTNEMAASGQEPAVAVREIIGTLQAFPGVPLVVFNAAYDLTMLDREARRYGIEPYVPGVVIDPFVIDKKIDRYRRGSRTLESAVAHYGGPAFDAHSSDGDAEITLRLARVIPRMIEGAPEDAAVLHDYQREWRADQQNSLRDYFDSRGTEHDGCNPAWPLIPAT